MSKENLSSAIVSPEASPSTSEIVSPSRSTVNRRSFLKGGVLAGAAAVGAGVLAGRLPAFAQKSSSKSLSAETSRFSNSSRQPN